MQCTLLGMLLFLVLINAAGFRENLKNIGKYVTKPFNTRKPMLRIHMKYVDNMTAAEAINLKKQLIANPNTNPVRPLQYHDRTEHILPEGQSQVQDLLDQLVNYCKEHQMKLNSQKTKVILFNNARNYDFMPRCSIGEDEALEVVEEIRLLGVMVTSDLKWNAHCDYI